MRRILAALLAMIMILCFSITASAASVDPEFYGAAYEDLNIAFHGDKDALQKHYDTYGINEGRAINLDDAISKGQTDSILRYYCSISENEYRVRALAGDNTYFDAEKYLQANPDVAAIAKGSKDYALEHYLKYGMLEGRSSCTAFDPAIAIINHPECLKQATNVAGNSNEMTSMIDALQTSWKQITGKDDTSGYQFSKKPAKSGSSYTGGTYSKAEGLGGADPYYSMLMYMCGTNLEDGKGGATRALLSFIFGASENDIGALLCAGGTDDWYSNYMKNMQPDHNTTVIYKVNGENAKTALDALCKQYNVTDFYKLDLYDQDVFDATANALITKDTLIPIKIYKDNTFPMNSEKTLETFLNVAAEDQLAQYYNISFWNHGNGMAEGVCFPDGDDSDRGLSAQDILKATQNSAIKHFEVMAFDLCLMGGVEFAAALKDVYTYMLASEETAIRDFDYREMMRVIVENIDKDNKEIAKIVAYTAIKDRYLYGNKGTTDSAATFAAYYTDKVMPAAKLVDAVGSELLNIAKTSNTAQDGVKYDELIYSAIRNARLHSEGFGGETTFSKYKYVDGSTFLTRLNQELNKAAGKLDDSHSDFKNAISNITANDTGSIDQASKAVAGLADIFTLCYNDTQLYFSASDFNDTIDTSQYWKDLKGTLITGSSLFVPYEVTDDTVTWYKEAMNGVGMDNYVSLISEYNTFINSTEEKTRRENLAKDLYDATSCLGYKDILSVAYKTAAGNHNSISVVISDYANDANISPDSSKDAFVDVIETLQSMQTYLMRYAYVKPENGEEKPNGEYQEIVLGSVNVNTEQAAGEKNTIEIPLESFEQAKLYSVMGTVQGVNKWDYVTRSVLDENDDDIDKVRAALQGGNTSLYTGDLITVRGETDKKTGAEYHVFEKSGTDVYSYIGSVIYSSGEISPVTEQTSINFYHKIDSTEYLELTKYEDVYYYLKNAPTYDTALPIIITAYYASDLKDIEHNQYKVEATVDGDKTVVAGSVYGTEYENDMYGTLPHIGESTESSGEESKVSEIVEEKTESLSNTDTEQTTLTENVISEHLIDSSTESAVMAESAEITVISEIVDTIETTQDAA